MRAGEVLFFIFKDMGKYLFVTANFGNDDNFPHCQVFDNHDFIMFTDNFTKYENSGWTLQELDHDFCKNVKINNILKNRYIKFQLHKEINILDYDMIVYCDGYMVPKSCNIWTTFSSCVKEFGIVQKLHKRNIYQECRAIHEKHKDTKTNMNNMIRYFKSLSVPPIHMYENTAFCYDPSNMKIIQVLDEFWSLYRHLNITYRDQPLWSYILYKNELNPCVKNKLFSNFEKVKICHRYV